MSDELLLRRKTTQVLWQLEEALINFIKNQGGETDGDKLYLTNFVTRAKKVVKGKSQEEHIIKLEKLCIDLEVFTIRNAIAHLNNEFHPCYWYRIAAIATDPSITHLNFLDVIQSWRDAEDGKLMSPPEEWITKPLWALPNNLPEQFDHTFTGLIGRKKELCDLTKLIVKSRWDFMAIVAAGGLGKTALLLEALAEIVRSPESAESIDRVLFLSSKTEQLTINGVQNIYSSSQTIQQVKTFIYQSLSGKLIYEVSESELVFEQICKEFNKERILLCLDNLETLLRDEPDAFGDFLENLPRAWRVIVTSRIQVYAAQTIALNPLDDNGSRRLAREYLFKRGAERLSEEEINNIVQSCNRIPLAIRLTIDGFIAGYKDLNQCISTANHQILEFSYKNLIEALSDVAYEVLECFFASPEPISRREAVYSLDISEDAISEAFMQLGRTSLVTKSNNKTEESYTLSESVRDLLLLNPLNISTRNQVQEKLRRRKQKLIEIQNSRGHKEKSPLSNDYIPESAPDTIKVIVATAFEELFWKHTGRHSLYEILQQIRQAINSYPNHQTLLYRVLGMILLELGDRTEGIASLQKAWEIEPRDIAAGLLLSKQFYNEPELAKSAAEHLVKLGWDDPKKSNSTLACFVVKNYCSSLIRLWETPQVIEYTNKWQNQEEQMRGSYGLMRVKALRESLYNDAKLNQIPKRLCEAIEILNQIFKSSEGYGGGYVYEGMKLLKELGKQARNNPGKFNTLVSSKFADFVDFHLVHMCQVHDILKLDSFEVRAWVKSISELPIDNGENPLKSERWKELLNETIEEAPVLKAEIESGWILVMVYYIPTLADNGNRKEFLFAKNSKTQQQYVIHRNKCQASLQKDWEEIKQYDSIEIVPDIADEDGKAIKVKKARWPKER
ncbi:NB-ARC domain-containing protein [Oscillatoria acuminata]|uniref:NB-ARC domain-containing protein n=1 Tax=Oscillatoria acuminata PCC 6304 TaxID=56110 RepID=K9TMP5_9CYAN|nr:NB-ARC domain-containing protein [Oscillatoria acuminata]AFY83274.1 NB-ARC domain-containing protein [Oscillatoria acuminata PCC 6304]